MDDLVLRDKSSERLYSMQDANWNVVAIADATAVVQERYAYSPYGVPVFLTPTFTSRASSSFTWQRLFTGQTYDIQAGLHHFRNRMLHSQVGTFITRDPIGYADGLSLYNARFVPEGVDPLGECVEAPNAFNAEPILSPPGFDPFNPNPIGPRRVADWCPWTPPQFMIDIDHYFTLGWRAACFKLGMMIATNYLDTWEEKKLWLEYIKGRKSPYKLSPMEMKSIVSGSKELQKEIKKLEADCRAGKQLGKVVKVNASAGPPWKLGIGHFTAYISTSCDCPCIKLTIDISDTYDFNPLPLRPGNEKALAVWMAQLLTRCQGTVWTPYQISGTYVYDNCEE